jgi:hypothetical protein
MNSPRSNPNQRNVEITRKSMVVLFTVGAILLVVPVGTVLSENSICSANPSSCIRSDSYRYLVSAFPYLMLGGGILIAYNMKRISDSISAKEIDEEENEDDGTFSYR